MKYENDNCQLCGKSTRVVKSKNGLARNLCASCIVDSIDMTKAEELRRLSITLQIPFSLQHYYTYMLTEPDRVKAMEMYLDYLSKVESLDYEEEKIYNWDKIDMHYNASYDYIRALAEIKPLRQAIEARGKTKWGDEFTFKDIVRLEDTYESTVKQYNITSALQQDAIRKASKLSIKIDQLIDGGDFKELKDATSAQASFLKTANIGDLAQTAKDDSTIMTVNDLAFYLESKGFQFSKMLPDIPQDAIDELMDNYMLNVKDLVYNATGIDQQFKDLIQQIKDSSEEEMLTQEAEMVPLTGEELEDYLEEQQREIDKELSNAQEEVDFNGIDFI